MPTKRLREFLDSEGVAYRVLPHDQTFTASETAEATHIKARKMVKTVIVQADGHYYMATLPAHRRVDLDALCTLVGAKNLVLADEQEFAAMFPGCEVGAMPPFGNLFDMRVLADASLLEDDEIAFNDGTHTHVVVMAFADFERLVRPVSGEFAA